MAPRKVAIVAGPDAGHAFPAFALAEKLAAQDISAPVWTGAVWHEVARSRGLDVAELPGLRARATDDDSDAGAKLGARAARMAVALAPVLAARGTDLVISDVITVGGLWAAELCGIPAIELSPHPLYLPSRGLPPIGAGLSPGDGVGGRLRDIALRTASNVSVRAGERQRATARRGIGLAESPPGVPRLIATLPALEVPRPDWPTRAHLVGPLLWEPTDVIVEPPPGAGPVVVVAPSTAVIGAADMLTETLAGLTELASRDPVRVVISALDPPGAEGFGAPGLSVTAGLGRQDQLVGRADVVVCGGGHGMLAKSLSAGVPVVTVPGGGDQWELANRVARQGSGMLVRPVEGHAIAEAVAAVLGDPGYARAAASAAASASDVVDPVRVVCEVYRRSVAGDALGHGGGYRTGKGGVPRCD
ncbi:glycosyltransferase [Gordonia sp. L191]|uniref:glycosyltransferase n=1 Tax=Gordonia sp. L191 TaxID=2982699 RepID=UPI0024C09397|nr:nucleotide disphospho-sugar-binding domain-containing protein [Gordonia sp. L191]WHU49744.1 glycosyltransferase [Gordonia sp. L191]